MPSPMLKSRPLWQRLFKYCCLFVTMTELHLPRRISSDFKRVHAELAERFGGTTAYSRAPAEGLWDGNEGLQRDDMIVVEVMVQRLNMKWWKRYRKELERRFRQDSILMRTLTCKVL